MTTRQRIIIWSWIAVVVAAGIYVPWARHDSPTGYHLIFAPPNASIHVDQTRLGVEWIIATVVAAGLYFTWPDRLSTGSENEAQSDGPDEIRPGDIFEAGDEAFIVRRVEHGKSFFAIKNRPADTSFISRLRHRMP